MSNRQMFPIKPAALYVGCDQRTIRRWELTGVLPFGVRPWRRYHRNDLDLAKARWKPVKGKGYKAPTRAAAGFVNQR